MRSTWALTLKHVDGQEQFVAKVVREIDRKIGGLGVAGLNEIVMPSRKKTLAAYWSGYSVREFVEEVLQ
jgi:hypothetical protein